MADSARRQALPFSAAEKVLQETPYIYTSGTVPFSESPHEWLFYQSWTDARVEPRNIDVSAMIKV
jgi:hypothetical protein